MDSPATEPEAWSARPEWAAGRIPSREGWRGVRELGVAVLLVAVSVGVLHLLEDRPDAPRAVRYLVGSFGAIGALVFVQALVRLAGRLRFGTARLELERVPLQRSACGQVAVLHVPARLRAPQGLTAILTHAEVVTRKCGDEQRRQELPRWQDVRRIPAEEVRRDGEETIVRLALDLPAGFRDSSPQRGGDRSLWRLEVRAAQAGPNFTASFELPVFGEAEQNDAQPGPTPRSLAPRELLELARFSLEDTASGLRAVQPSLPSPGMASSLAFGTFLFWGATIAVIDLGIPWIFAVFLGGFALLLTLCLAESLFGRARLEATHGELHFATGLPLLGRRGVLAREQLAKLRVASGDRYGSRQLFHLEAPRTDAPSRSFRLVASLPDRATADALHAELTSAVQRAA